MLQAEQWRYNILNALLIKSEFALIKYFDACFII